MIGLLVLLAGVASPPAPAYKGLDGQERRVESLRGQVVVINFWATWCKPCLEEMPALARLHRRFEGAGVAVVGLSADDPSEVSAVGETLRRLEIRYPVGLGATTDDMVGLGLDPKLPGTVVLARDGSVAARFSGVFDERVLVGAVESALAASGASETVSAVETAAAAPARRGGSRVPP